MDKMIVGEWLKFAENDLAVVHILLNHHPMQRLLLKRVSK